MKIVDVKINEIKEYKDNPRYNDDAVEYVANSIEEFGFKVPVIIDKNNVIIAGHTRIKAAIKLGLESVPCLIADDLSDEQIKAFRLADNKVGEIATWDFERLENELREISLDDIDMSLFDFDLSFDEEVKKEYKTDNNEINEDEFDDDNFTHECPKCGFKWSEEE